MITDLDTLQERYFACCRRQGIPANEAVLSALIRAKLKKARHEECSFVVLLDDLKDVDFHPVHDLLMEVDVSEIDTVDMISRSSCPLSGEYVLSLLRAISKKLRVVNLQDISFGKDFLLDLAQRGLACQVLHLQSSRFRKLNMSGSFERMHTLNLDFSTSLSSFREDCFVCMPNLKFLSLCETRVVNLWTTIAALAKLAHLTELRFQNCISCNDEGHGPSFSNRLCCDDAEHCPTLSRRTANGRKSTFSMDSVRTGMSLLSSEEIHIQDSNMEEEDMDIYNGDSDGQNTPEDSSDNSEVDFSSSRPDISQLEFMPDVPPAWNEVVNMQNEISYSISRLQDNEELYSSSLGIRPPKKYISYHASPICYEKYYREFLTVSLPKLEKLDNLPIEKIDRDRANDIFAQNFECLPNKRRNRESVVCILHKREINANHTGRQGRKEKFSCPSGKSQYFHSRSLSAAKVGSSAWPALRPLSISGSVSRDERRSFRPRQFEYHPSDPRLMVFGTLDGEVVVINHESEKIISYIPSLGAMHSVLGLCWLKTHPSKLIAGSDNGSLKLFDIQQTPATTTSTFHSVGSVTYDEFDQLTSVHVNSSDDLFLASGYSKHVALYDVSCGKRIQVFSDMHEEHINVVKFSNHSPSIFCTSSFDQYVKMWDLRQKPSHPCYTASSSRGNVMVCFSPDDHYLLVSAVDNEVKQLLAVDGRLHMDFGISSTGSSQNYTRSYYMNGKDYVISGSCDENVVRICCSQTGRRLRDVSLEGKGSGASMFVQSLRGDPFRDFNMSVLAAYIRPSSNSEIVKVNLLSSRDCDRDCSSSRNFHPLSGMGG